MPLVVPFRRIGVTPLVGSSSEDVSRRVRDGPKYHELLTPTWRPAPKEDRA